jgi:hypothetical protein
MMRGYAPHFFFLTTISLLQTHCMKRETKKRFNALLSSFCNKKGISEKRAGDLTQEDKIFMCRCIVQNRSAILSTLVPDDPEFISWLNAMGYGYEYVNIQGLHFNGTCAHFVRFAVHPKVIKMNSQELQ